MVATRNVYRRRRSSGPPFVAPVHDWISGTTAGSSWVTDTGTKSSQTLTPTADGATPQQAHPTGFTGIGNGWSMTGDGADVGFRIIAGNDGGSTQRTESGYHAGSTGKMSLEIVAKPTTLVDSEWIWGKSVLNAFSGYEFSVALMANGAISATFFTLAGANVADYLSAAGAWVAGVPHHLIVAYDRAATRLEVFKDGVKVPTATGTEPTFSGVTAIGGSSTWRAGNRGDASQGAGHPFNGWLGGMAVYDYALVASQALTRYGVVHP